MLIAESDSLLGLSVFSVVLFLIVVPIAGIVTGMKGRWGWLVFGLLIAGLPWLATALQSAEPGSWWDRRQQRKASTTKA